MTLPAVPGLLDEYVRICLDTFAVVGVRFDESESERLRQILGEQLETAFTASPRSDIVITYDSPVGHLVNYRVASRWATIEQSYDHWAATREPPLFGNEPDARVWGIASGWSAPTDCRVLDIGAGTGRNALALARRGHHVDAIEVSGEFARQLDEAAEREALPITVLRRDVLRDPPDLRRAYELVVISEVVSDLRSTDELHRILAVAGAALAPGGRVVLNAFVAQGDYVPDAIALQLGQQTYTAVFTMPQIVSAANAAGLIVLHDTPLLEYERMHHRADSWPPTPWYEGWASGRDLFSGDGPQPPIEMRWVVLHGGSD